jgi:uncharacterized protein (UPF0335 family)
MRKIKYNIANNKKVDYRKFAMLSAIVLVISLLFVLLGVGNLWSSDKRAQDQANAMKKAEEEIERLTSEINQLKEDGKLKKNVWKQRVSFANELIRGKEFSTIDQMEIMEKNLPEGVFFTQFNLDIENPNIQVGIAADSLQRLIEAYDRFAQYRRNLKDEVEDEGLFKATLVLNLKSGSADQEKPVEAPAVDKKKELDDSKELSDALK